MSIEAQGELQAGETVSELKTGFVQVDGALGFDVHDATGLRTLWVACPRGTFTDNWSVRWKPLSVNKGCFLISLKVVPL